jgi:putative membrane protein
VHTHGAASPVEFDVVTAVVLLVFAAAYVGAAWANRRRRPWPAYRSILWVAGLACVYAGITIGASPHTASFAFHMVGHLLVGMLGPMLMVFAAPVTLALRSLDVVPARRVSRFLKSGLVRVLTHPVSALLLTTGGLWLLFGTELYSRMHTNALLTALVHVHFFLSGYVFAVSLVGVDPNPHRSSYMVRSIILTAGLAAHNVLAKYLYGHPPAGVTLGQAEAGSVVMYYGGGAIEAVLVVVLCAQWFRASAPREVGTREVRRRQEGRHAAAGGQARRQARGRWATARAEPSGVGATVEHRDIHLI